MKAVQTTHVVLQTALLDFKDLKNTKENSFNRGSRGCPSDKATLIHEK